MSPISEKLLPLWHFINLNSSQRVRQRLHTNTIPGWDSRISFRRARFRVDLVRFSPIKVN